MSGIISAMTIRKATLLIRYRDGGGMWQRAAVAVGGNGRIRQGYALIDGVEEQVSEYNYQVRTYKGRQATYTPV